MKNQYSEANAVEVTAPYTVASGAGCLVGSMFGVASFAATSGTALTMYTRGSYTLAAVALQAWTMGALLYWDDTAKLVTTVVATNKIIGVALAVKANAAGATTGIVRLNGSFLS